MKSNNLNQIWICKMKLCNYASFRQKNETNRIQFKIDLFLWIPVRILDKTQKKIP